MSRSEKFRGGATQVRGRVRELAGRATGNSRMRSRGRFEQFKGKAIRRTSNFKDSVRGTVRDLRAGRR